MFIVRLSDGIGNQMFQYALGRHLERRTDETVLFDATWFDRERRTNVPNRTLMIDNFDIDIEFAERADIRSLLGPIGRWLRQRKGLLEKQPALAARFCDYYFEIRSGEGKVHPTWPTNRRFYPEVLDISGDLYVDGYWQTPKYFEGIAETIRRDFSVNGGLSEKDAEIAEAIAETTAISIHIRRGDQPDQGPDDDPLGNALPLKYYHKAASTLADEVDAPEYFVFSDDPEWAGTNLDLDHPTTVVSHNDGSTAHLDMLLMSRCDHHIIANSTFSVWGAWLNPSADKEVIAPTPWKRYRYPADAVYDWDLLPDAWRVLAYEAPERNSD